MNANAPHLLLIQTDQHMATALGCYGNPIVRTPNLDRLASHGRRFTNAYCASPICTPARASLQTGLLPCHHGMTTNIYTRGCMLHELADHSTLLPRRLQGRGYHTGFTGKWHLGFGPDPESQPEWHHHVRATPALARHRFPGALPSTFGYEGDDFPGHGGVGTSTPQFRDHLARRGIEYRKRVIFEAYPHTYEVLSGPESTVTSFLTDRAVATIDDFLARPGGRPFAYQLHFWGPHADYHASTPFLDLYRDVKIPEWPSFREARTASRDSTTPTAPRPRATGRGSSTSSACGCTTRASRRSTTTWVDCWTIFAPGGCTTRRW
jgi:arylsulfatase A-like enzyme